ncbi:glycosyltransferase [Arsenicicoccus sp. oral taxon 190]|uniref:glycosyltransferase n=1 Tax=Arsenicicoccus sp. oral taxon 190 TaxID=1658671 RepID=UPI00209ECA16|nr:glycosyltransferase [Arsenicicoccus sp. oral taxon 190]
MTEGFSVLMCVYRADDPEHLGEALRSVTVEQTRRPDQVVLVQDGPVPARLASTIEALVAGSQVPVDLVRLPDNRGLGVALTAGLARCRHDVVARMDADDIALPRRFEVQVPIVEQGVDVVGSGMLEIGRGRDDVVGRRVPPLTAEHIVASSRMAQPFNHPTVVYRRSAVAAAGGYQDFKQMEDYLLFARMIQGGARVANVAEPLLCYRVGEGAYARRGGWSMLRTELALQRRFLAMGFTTPAQCARNVLVRGVYRLVPEGIRKVAYRAIMARRGEHSR